MKYPGTGDVFASILLGELLRQVSLPDAIIRAETFVSAAVGKPLQPAPIQRRRFAGNTLNNLLEAKTHGY